MSECKENTKVRKDYLHVPSLCLSLSLSLSISLYLSISLSLSLFLTTVDSKDSKVPPRYSTFMFSDFTTHTRLGPLPHSMQHWT